MTNQFNELDLSLYLTDESLEAAQNLTEVSNDFFATADGNLTEEVNTSYEELHAEIVQKVGKEKAEKAKTALSIISLRKKIEAVKEGDPQGHLSAIVEQLFVLGVERTQWWTAKNENSASGLQYGTGFKKALLELVEENTESKAFKDFSEAYKYFSGYEVKNDKGVKSLYTKEGRELTLVKELEPTSLSFSLLRSGDVRMTIKRDTTLLPVKGREFRFERDYSTTLGSNILNKNLLKVMSSLRIHNVWDRIEDYGMHSQYVVKEFTKESLKFRKEDSLVLFMLLKENKIDIKTLYLNVEKGLDRTLILARNSSSTIKCLERITAPAYIFKKVYGNTGVVSLNEAKQGFVSPMVSIPRLVEFTVDSLGNHIAVTRENANKTASRFDKQDNSKSIWVQSIEVALVVDATKNTKLNEALVGGNILSPNEWFVSNGACRIVTSMDNGGIKSTTTPFQSIGKIEGYSKGNLHLIGAQGFKGGALAALGLAYGDLDYVKNLMAINSKDSNSDEILKGMMINLLKKVTTITVDGEVVHVIRFNVDVKVTNTYTVDMFRLVEEDEDTSAEGEKARVAEMIRQVVGDEEVIPSGLRSIIAQKKAEDANFSVMQYIQDGLNEGTISRKPLVTRIIPQEIQSIALWYGKDVAERFLEELMDAQLDRGVYINKLYASQFIGSLEKDIINHVNVQEIVDILKEEEYGITLESAVYSKETYSRILDLLQANQIGWTTIEYQNGETVDIPGGSILIDDALKQLQGEKSIVVSKGLMYDLLENIKSMIDKDGNLFPKTSNHLYLSALVQKFLLGKEFGYQYTRGYYGVAMPLLGNYAFTTAGVTNRYRLTTEETQDETWVRMTLSKAPQYFEGMTSSYDVADLDFGRLMNLALECAIFVNVEVVMHHQNDFDGDQYRITTQTSLPMVQKLYNRFNGNFFKDFWEGELASNKLKFKKSQSCFIGDYHKAIFDAITAKDHIGSYTANSYFYEAMLSNLLGNTVLNSKGEELVITEELAYLAQNLLKMLIQIEAMDNVKQEGSQTYITDLLLHYKLRSLTSDRVESHLTVCKSLITSLTKTLRLDLSAEEIEGVVETLYATASLFDTKELKAMGLFNARNVNEKSFASIAAHLKGEELVDTFNYSDCYQDIVNQADESSMYRSIIERTMELCIEASDSEAGFLI